MKTRSTVMEATNIAAIVKARHHARVICPTSGHSLGSAQSQFISGGIYEPSETSCNMSTYYNVSTTSGQAVCDDGKLSVEDKAHKSRSGQFFNHHLMLFAIRKHPKIITRNVVTR